jgi:M6 family metalloprotease-like protein
MSTTRRTAFQAAALCCLLGAVFATTSRLAAAGSRTTPVYREPPPDLSEYRTVAQAKTTRVSRETVSQPGQAGYLGVVAEVGSDARLTVSDVEPGSPAALAGVRQGDALLKLNSQPVKDGAALRELLQARAPGESVALSLTREGKAIELPVRLAATSRPMGVSAQRGVLGVRVAESREGEGVVIQQLTPGLPAEGAGLKNGDVILKVEDSALTAQPDLTDALAGRQPGDSVALKVRREGKDFDVTLRLAADSNPAPGAASARAPRRLFSKEAYHLAVIPVEFPDVKHSPRIGSNAWHASLFSQGSYKANALGQTAYGSVNDYYLEQSCGALRVEGRVFDWVVMQKKRADYAPATSTASKTPFLTEALDTLLAREGSQTLREFDGVLFIFAGERPTASNRGSLYWPHKGNVTHRGRAWTYFICPEGGARMANISVFAHEFGHMLGLPDLYARPENPGSEGLGIWCAMSNQSGNGRPQHFGAWCKEQLGWLKPALLDPTVKQKLILGPVEGSSNQCYKVLLRRDGSEYLLLENRRRTGFDQSLPAEGLLVWRVVQGRPVLEESHGIDGPAGPRTYLRAVPYPSDANHSFTPYTTPSSRSLLGGGLPVFITNIRQLADGRITFQIGYEFE